MRSGIPSPLDGFPSPFGPQREDEEQQQDKGNDEAPADDQTDQKS